MRLVIAEDSVLLREGLTEILTRADHQVVAAVGDADALVDAVAATRPDLVVTDVRMPPDQRDDGLRAALALRRDDPALPVVVLSQHVERAYAAELLASGEAGVGYLLKESIGEVVDFLDALARVAAGAVVIDPEVVRSVLGAGARPISRLTPREREVLSLVAQGRSNASVASALFVTEAAVAKHVSSIFTRLGLAPDAADHRRVLAVLTYLRG